MCIEYSNMEYGLRDDSECACISEIVNERTEIR